MLNKFKHFLIFFILLLSFCFGFFAYAKNNSLVVVYPENNSKIYANSTFFTGHTNPRAKLTINNKIAKVYPDGSFVEVISLSKGNNEVILKSVSGSDVKIKKFNLIVPDNGNYTTITQDLQPLNQVMIVKDKEAPLRVTPYGDRLTPLKKGVVVEISGLINNHYKIKLPDNTNVYAGKSVLELYDGEKIKIQKISDINLEENNKNILIKIPLKQPVLTEISEGKNNLKVKLHGTNMEFNQRADENTFIRDISFSKDTINISLNMQNLNGYDYWYDENTFVLQIRKPLKKGLKGKIITIDAGHGGREFGSVGPTEVKEKDINLQISKYLKRELEKAGAKVIMTRTDDSFVDLYKRVDIARENNSDILISIHNNALPDGLNPYEIHGTTSYYYNNQAIKLADKIQNNLVKATGFPDLGVRHASFVLTRPTLPVSVLIEIGFMINPFEYSQLQIAKNQKRYAKAIKKGIEEYCN